MGSMPIMQSSVAGLVSHSGCLSLMFAHTWRDKDAAWSSVLSCRQPSCANSASILETRAVIGRNCDRPYGGSAARAMPAVGRRPDCAPYPWPCSSFSATITIAHGARATCRPESTANVNGVLKPRRTIGLV
jgi:hypothetical protein